MDKNEILPQCVTLSGVGHFGSSSSLQRLRFKIQPSPGMVSTRQSLVGSELVCSQPWSFQADTQYKLVSSSNSLKVCEKYEKKSAIVKRKEKDLVQIVNTHQTKVFTVFENHRKSRVQNCKRSQLRLHFKWTKIN